MDLKIKRISCHDLTSEKFVEDFLSPEIPLIINGFDDFNDNGEVKKIIKEKYMIKKNQDLGWYNSNLKDSDLVKTPELISDLIKDKKYSFRENPVRIFMQPGGHKTLAHYDGNSLHGFNLQVVGEKKWVIISPKTPIPHLPFMYAGLVGKGFNYDSSKFDIYIFKTKPGDMLFLPRYWCHEVSSLDTTNININWVCTPMFPNLTSKIGRREAEIIKLRSSISLINKAYFPDSIETYGGKGKELTKVYSKNVSILNMITRVFKELSAYPKLLVLAKEIRKNAGIFSKNNFNV